MEQPSQRVTNAWTAASRLAFADRRTEQIRSTSVKSPSLTSVPHQLEPTMASPTDSTKSPPAPAAPKKPAATPPAPGSPARGNSRSSSSTRSAAAPKTSPDPSAPASAPASDKKPATGGAHQRKQSGRGGGKAGVHAAGKKEPTGGKTPPTATAPAGSEGLSNLKNLIAEISTPATAPTPIPSNSQGHSQSPASRSNKPSLAHRKNASGGGAAPNPAQLNTSGGATLNPNASGFHPGSLGSISDMMDEGLITPTASQFDLMTGLPRSSFPSANANFNGGFRGTGAWGAQAGEQPEELPGFGAAGASARAFAFPPPNPAAVQQAAAQQVQAMQLAMLQQQAQQQQQFQMHQLAQLSGGFSQGNAGGQGDAAALMAEQMAIQQQLENLRLQQESLLQRFGDMQAHPSPLVDQQPHSPRQQAPHHGASQSIGGGGQAHRRVQSHQQVGGMMGSFGQGMGSFGGSASGGNPFQGAGPPASNLPKGHGRRHSVNVVNKSASASTSPNMNAGQAPMGGFGALGGAFQFPNNVAASQTRQDQQLGEAEFAASGGGSNFRHSHHRTQSGSISSLGGWSLSASLTLAFSPRPLTHADSQTTTQTTTPRARRTSPKRNRTCSSSPRTAPRRATRACRRLACPRLPAAAAPVPASSRWRRTAAASRSRAAGSRSGRAFSRRTSPRPASRPSSRPASSSLAS